jgi:hypothetical protein
MNEPESRFDRSSPLWWLTLIAVAGISAIGARFLIAPRIAAEGFGVPLVDLMEMDFAVTCPLVRRLRLISDFCSSTRTFAIRFLQTPPHGDSPCVLASPSPPSG